MEGALCEPLPCGLRLRFCGYGRGSPWRGDGAHDYNFANDLTWSTGPGYYLVRNPETIVGLQFVVSGEHKDVDRFRGEPAEDTGITSVFVGPRRPFCGDVRPELMERYLQALYVHEWADTNRPEGV